MWLLNQVFNIQFFIKRKIVPGFKISRDALVLDIGSGDKPFWRADVTADRLDLGDNQRWGNSKTITDQGLFVNADVTDLPFEDKTFDFAFCSHLLEHVLDPEAAVNEITRVAKAGYIEVPNGVLETMKPFHSHLWRIFVDQGRLVFIRKSKEEHKLFLENYKHQGFHTNNLRNPFIRFYWESNLPVTVIDSLTEEEKFTAIESKDLDGKQSSQLNPYGRLNHMLRKLFYKRKDGRLKALSEVIQ